MTIEGAADLVEALTRSDFDAVVGTAESEWIDFKRDPYPLDTPKGLWELAKDVAAFAQNRGGYIVIGYETAKRASEGIEVASAVHRFPRALVNITQYRDLIDRRVYPHVRDVRIKWFPPEDEETGILLIEIPAQSENDKPFLLVSMLNDQGVEQVNTVGLPRRDGDRVSWEHPETIHREIHSGRRLGIVGVESSHELADRSQETRAALERTILLTGESVPAFYALQMVSNLVNRPRTDPVGLEALRRAIVDASTLRSLGFNFRNAGEPRIAAGRALEVEGRSRGLRIEPDGIVTAVFAADRDGLGWAVNQYLPEGAPLQINSIALVELTLEFFRLVHGAIGPLWAESASWQVIESIVGMKSANVVLLPGLPTQGFVTSVPGYAHTASADEWGTEFASYLDPEKDALVSLVNFYGLWGLGPDAIPSVEDDRVSSERVQRLGRESG